MEVAGVTLRNAHKENKRAKRVICSFLFFKLSLEFGLGLTLGLKFGLGLGLGLGLE